VRKEEKQMTNKMKALWIASLALLLAGAAFGQTPDTTYVTGWYIGESFYNWGTNPVLRGSADVCSQREKDIPKALRQACRSWNNAKNGGLQQIDIPPFSFFFKDSVLQQISINFPSYDAALARAIEKFGQPFNTSTGNGDINTFAGSAYGSGRRALWLEKDGTEIVVSETITASSIGVSTSATVLVFTHDSEEKIYGKTKNIPSL
jgi:hypothetical protein